jgi:type II secretory pathway pseudopilin PulG
MKNKKQNSGITLIVLIIMIIVLLILAGISINTIVGDDGIIAKAKETADAGERATQNEQTAINEIEEIKNGGGTSEGDEEAELYQLLHLTIMETLFTYNGSLGEVQMVYRIDVENNSDVVYSDVRGLKFTTAGEKSVDVDVYVPNSSVVKVTKVYNGGSYENVGDVSKQFTISQKGEIYKELDFSSDYSGSLIMGAGATVRFNRNNDNWEVEYEK